MNFDDLLKDFDQSAGASREAIEAAEAALALEIPSDYKEFLLRTNGGAGEIGSSYLELFPAEELKQHNQDYQFPEYAPGLLLIGSDGGGEAYVFDRRGSPWAVGRVPFVGMGLKYLRTGPSEGDRGPLRQLGRSTSRPETCFRSRSPWARAACASGRPSETYGRISPPRRRPSASSSSAEVVA
jgi:SMI1 / KNR4 family (SUKH-1)